MKKTIYSLFPIFLAFLVTCKANNLQIGTPVFTNQIVSTGTVQIQFDISWDNSWRTNNLNGDGITNSDAVWLFVKYKNASDGLWYHASLNTSISNSSTGTIGTGAILHPRADGVGAFLYRSENGSGTFSSNQVKICWNYATNNLSNDLEAEILELQVFGIEMVYIPQGAFYIGSGGSEDDHFYTYGGNTPYQISSEGPITVGTANGNLYYSNISSWGSDQAGPIPTSFPKGYFAFYCMKYEITQEQYSDFLNTLTSTQQSTRFPNYFNQWRYFIKFVNGIYGCDANNNGILNEFADGQNIACNWLSWADGIAYSDWCGLRPMTELEYEKICRGSATPVPNENAWGSTSITSASTGVSNMTNSGQATEGSNVSGANCNYYTSNGYIPGPLRVGCFSGGSRPSSGASYYGVMEMSGNLRERCVTVGNYDGRAFTGSVGDGILDVSGNANIATCPGITAVGAGFRGGDWGNDFHICRTSDRIFAADTYDRSCNVGFRCVSGL